MRGFFFFLVLSARIYIFSWQRIYIFSFVRIKKTFHFFQSFEKQVISLWIPDDNYYFLPAKVVSCSLLGTKWQKFYLKASVVSSIFSLRLMIPLYVRIDFILLRITLISFYKYKAFTVRFHRSFQIYSNIFIFMISSIYMFTPNLYWL